MRRRVESSEGGEVNDAFRKPLRVRRNDLYRTVEIKATSKDDPTQQKETLIYG